MNALAYFGDFQKALNAAAAALCKTPDLWRGDPRLVIAFSDAKEISDRVFPSA